MNNLISKFIDKEAALDKQANKLTKKLYKKIDKYIIQFKKYKMLKEELEDNKQTAHELLKYTTISSLKNSIKDKNPGTFLKFVLSENEYLGIKYYKKSDDFKIIDFEILKDINQYLENENIFNQNQISQLKNEIKFYFNYLIYNNKSNKSNNIELLFWISLGVIFFGILAFLGVNLNAI